MIKLKEALKNIKNKFSDASPGFSDQALNQLRGIVREKAMLGQQVLGSFIKKILAVKKYCCGNDTLF